MYHNIELLKGKKYSIENNADKTIVIESEFEDKASALRFIKTLGKAIYLDMLKTPLIIAAFKSNGNIIKQTYRYTCYHQNSLNTPKQADVFFHCGTQTEIQPTIAPILNFTTGTERKTKK